MKAGDSDRGEVNMLVSKGETRKMQEPRENPSRKVPEEEGGLWWRVRRTGKSGSKEGFHSLRDRSNGRECEVGRIQDCVVGEERNQGDSQRTASIFSGIKRQSQESCGLATVVNVLGNLCEMIKKIRKQY